MAGYNYVELILMIYTQRSTLLSETFENNEVDYCKEKDDFAMRKSLSFGVIQQGECHILLSISPTPL